jgi:hypothetical protein
VKEPTGESEAIPMIENRSRVDSQKIQRLYLQASNQQWAPLQTLDFKSEITLDEEARRIWIRLGSVFYTLENLGLNVLANMIARAPQRLASEETLLYLTMQSADEARHVFVLEKYLRKLGHAPQHDRNFQVLGRVASLGFFRVENWLFSTLFSENFASSFLRRSKAAHIDPLGADLCRHLLIDESRHIHFLHLVLPDVLDRLSLAGRAYVKLSQRFIMKFTERVSRTLAEDAKIVGIDRRDLLEEVFENVEKAYEGFGVTRQFLHFPKINSALAI